MSEKKLVGDALRRLSSIGDEAFLELGQDELQAALHEAMSSSLFRLSREAASIRVREEAAAVLATRLRGEEEVVQPVEEATPEELPPELATHRHFYKFADGERWALTTRSGVRVATFASEAELDQWWLGLKRQRGRILTKRRKQDGKEH